MVLTIPFSVKHEIRPFKNKLLNNPIGKIPKVVEKIL